LAAFWRQIVLWKKKREFSKSRLLCEGMVSSRGAPLWVPMLVGMGCAVVLLQLTLSPAARRGALEELPPVIGELEQHINVEDAKSFLNDIREKGLAGTTLHPYGDLNPFTHEPEAEDNPESVIRRAKVRAIVWQAANESKQEMADAQQAARDFMGSDAGCTHEKTDQTDYSGEIAQTVSGQDCLPWTEAADLLLYNVSADEGGALPENAVSNYCRNPFGERIAAWCVLASAKTVLEETGNMPVIEGQNWEYCDIGRRCAVDVPILKSKPVAGGAGALKTPAATQLKAATAAPSVAAAQLRVEVGQQLRGVGKPAAAAVLAAPHRGQMRGRAMANGGAHKAQHELRSSIMARRASHFEPEGHNSLSHKQQLAMVAAGGLESGAGRVRESIYAHGGISGQTARKLVGKVCPRRLFLSPLSLPLSLLRLPFASPPLHYRSPYCVTRI